MKKYLSIVTIAALGLAGCGGNIEAPAPAVTEESSPAPSASVDAPKTAAKKEQLSAIQDYLDSLDKAAAEEKPSAIQDYLDSLDKAAAEEKPSATPDYHGRPDALEAYVELARPAFEAVMARYSDIYSKVDLAAVLPNTMYYIYTYRDDVDAGQLRAQLESQNATFDGIARTIKPEMRQAGVENPKINWVYLNSDGSQMATVER